MAQLGTSPADMILAISVWLTYHRRYRHAHSTSTPLSCSLTCSVVQTSPSLLLRFYILVLSLSSAFPALPREGSVHPAIASTTATTYYVLTAAHSTLTPALNGPTVSTPNLRREHPSVLTSPSTSQNTTQTSLWPIYYDNPHVPAGDGTGLPPRHPFNRHDVVV